MIRDKRRLQLYTTGTLTLLMIVMGFLWAAHALRLYRTTIERQIAEDNDIVKDNLSIIIQQVTLKYSDRDRVIAQIQNILEALKAKGWNGFACVLDKNGRVLAHPDRAMVDRVAPLKLYEPQDLLGSFPPPVTDLPQDPDVKRAIYKTPDDIIAIDWLPKLMTYLCVHKSHHPITEKIEALRRRLMGVGLLIVALTAAGAWWFVGNLVDRYESHLARSEARNRALVQNSAPILIATPEGDLLDANPQAETLFRIDRSNLLSRHLGELWSKKDGEALARLLAVTSEGALECHDLDLRTGAGGIVPADVRACRIDYGDRDAVYLLIRNVAEARRAREEILEANRKLKELDQLKTDFINTVSHELRTPLTSIHWSTESLSDLIEKDNSTVEKLVRIIRDDNRRLANLIEELLNFSRLGAGKQNLALQNVDLSELARKALEEIQPVAQKKGIEIALHLASSALSLRADPEQLRRIAINLLDNAVKYTPEKGSVTVRLAAEDRWAVFEIADSGIGIPLSDQPHIFEKFYRTDQAGVQRERGTGLGLAIVKGIVEAHGGDIGVRSRPGAGAVFTVRLPIDGPQA